jgi:hypothetical protein
MNGLPPPAFILADSVRQGEIKPGFIPPFIAAAVCSSAGKMASGITRVARVLAVSWQQATEVRRYDERM